MQCIITEKQSNQNNHDSHVVRAKENLMLSHGGPSQRQVSGTNQRIKGPSLSVRPDPPSCN